MSDTRSRGASLQLQISPHMLATPATQTSFKKLEDVKEPEKAKPERLTFSTRLKLGGALAGTLIGSTVQYVVKGPTIKTWSYATHIFRDVLERFLSHGADNPDPLLDVVQSRLNNGKLPKPKDCILEEVVYRTSGDAIRFMRSQTDSFPESANEVNDVKSEWIYPVNHAETKTVVMHIHGGAYVLGTPQMDRKVK
jgi:hypothetical protein